MGETQPPANWPGLEPERDGVVYSPQKILNIAGALREAMKPISGEGYGQRQGSVADFDAYGNLSDMRAHLKSVDRIEGIKTFVDTLATSHQEFATVYGQVLENFQIAISLIEAGAGNYQVTNTANGQEA
ncbi:hypothetical protein [Nonomuraea jiangxiensis]|uniref:PE family protein n=1 Tax=Nonomuraea jiangxiensis TaxID=633440 RepID=A0A1G8FI63_9ACTN|nr:hypothetical protein [Nonomuraea jiangxiensis]SDH81857.1 hypothetical protein SAMN05421869_103327 [Nonomuraea jiangxiensis]